MCWGGEGSYLHHGVVGSKLRGRGGRFLMACLGEGWQVQLPWVQNGPMGAAWMREGKGKGGIKGGIG